jgi:hypothetical protein
LGWQSFCRRLWSNEEFSRFQTLTVVDVDERQRGHGAEIEFCVRDMLNPPESFCVGTAAA